MTKLILILVAEIFLLTAIASAGDDFARTMNKKLIDLPKHETLTHLRLYWHDSIGGQNPSTVRIQQPVSNSSLFGSISMTDDALTTDVMKITRPWNPVMEKVREMPVVGGSGMFRFARGYVEARTKFVDLKSGVAIVEYNCYVLHY
ncbi:hypothetical protein YC2023_005988 [Brassica napus]